MSHVEQHPDNPDQVIIYDTDADGIVDWTAGVVCPNSKGEFDHMLIEPPVRSDQ